MYVIPAALVFVDYLESGGFEILTLYNKLDQNETYAYSLMKVGEHYSVQDETTETQHNYRLGSHDGELPTLEDVDNISTLLITAYDDNEYELTDEVSGRKLSLRKVSLNLYELIEDGDFILQLE